MNDVGEKDTCVNMQEKSGENSTDHESLQFPHSPCMNSIKKKAQKLVAVIATYSETNIINICCILYFYMYIQSQILLISCYILYFYTSICLLYQRI
jgi:hypothetical protein